MEDDDAFLVLKRVEDGKDVYDERFPPYLRLYWKEIGQFLKENNWHLLKEFTDFLTAKTGDTWYKEYALNVLNDAKAVMVDLSKNPPPGEKDMKDMGVPQVRTAGTPNPEELKSNRIKEINEKIVEEAERLQARVVSTLLYDILHNQDAIEKLDKMLKQDHFYLWQQVHLCGIDGNSPAVKTFFEKFYSKDDPLLLDRISASFGSLKFLPKLAANFSAFTADGIRIRDPHIDSRDKMKEFLRNIPRLAVEDDEWFYAFLELSDAEEINGAMMYTMIPNYEDILDEREAMKRLAREMKRGEKPQRMEEEVDAEDLLEMRKQDKYAEYIEKPPYGEITDSKVELRDYQEELVKHAIKGKNTVVVAPTGAGKTEVCIFVAQNHIEEREKKGLPSRVVMLVPKVPLVDQQEARFRKYFKGSRIINGFHGDLNIRGHSRQKVFLGSEIIVMTAEILMNMLRSVRAHERLYLADISLLIFDEVHHCTKEHVYKRIMKYIVEYPHEHVRPQILGLTATPLPHATTNVESALGKIYELLADTNCHSLSTVIRCQEGLQKHVPKPDEEFEKVDPEKESQFNDSLKTLIGRFKKRIDGDIKELLKPIAGPYLRPNEVLVTYTKAPGLFLAKVNAFREALNRLTSQRKTRPLIACEYFISFGTALCMNELMPSKYAMDFLRGDMERLGHKFPSDLAKEFQDEYKDYEKELAQMSRAKEEKPIVEMLKMKLRENFDKKPDSRCIIFVAERSTARNLCDYLNKEGILGMNQVGFVTSSKSGTGQTAEQQRETLNKFNSGTIKCVVSTSVLDEGLDVTSCNLIIKYNTSSSAVSKIQRAGRARARDSKSIFLCLHEGIAESEYMAIVTGNMMKKCVELMSVYGDGFVEREVKQVMEKKKKEAQQQKKADEEIMESLKDHEFEIVCRIGNHFICDSDSIRVEGSHYVIVDRNVWERLQIEVAYKKKAVDLETMVLGEVICAGDKNVSELENYSIEKIDSQGCSCKVGKIMKLAGVYLPHLKASEIAFRQKMKVTEEPGAYLMERSWKTIAEKKFHIAQLSDHDVRQMLNALNEAVSPVQMEMMIKLDACVEKLGAETARAADIRRMERERKEANRNKKKDDYDGLCADSEEEEDKKMEKKMEAMMKPDYEEPENSDDSDQYQ